MAEAETETIRRQPIGRPPRGWYPPVKRLADVVVSAIGILLISPILLATAAAIKLTSPGAVFFTQDRGGRGGKPFRILKFRTMRAGRTPDPKELVPLDHPEITRVGRILRRTKIDELPQIINVLLGDMSIIGPRPTLPDQVERYDEYERQRLWVRPGCTGLAQIHGNTGLTWPERFEWDLYYVQHLSLWLDLQVLFRTPLLILLGDGRFVRRFDEAHWG
ncbi:MAG: sugar transferase [Phycisphaerae bacterium]|nr:sugar transferase [Phycisphaerae bacterium]